MMRSVEDASTLTSPDGGPRPGVAPVLLWGALATVYVVWGSTYLAIRVAIETLPPLLMASVRFIVAGALLYAWAVRRGDRSDRPTLVQWKAAAIVGGALLLGGNGMVVLAEQHIPTGTTALLVATVPLWMVLIGRVVIRERVTLREVAGLALGFGGVALLVGLPTDGSLDPYGIGLGIMAALLWAAGSLYSRRSPMPARPLLSTAMQMLAGGILLGLAGIVRGELAQVHPERFSMASLLGLGYLVVFGSWAGFSAYMWLLRVARTSLASTYAYVNPVIAVFLGWLILDERVTAVTGLAGAVIVVGVALIVTAGAAARQARPEPARWSVRNGRGAEHRAARPS